MEDTAAATLPYDIILDILLRVSTDSAALFRCAAASKQWRAFIADRAFLKRCWTENGGRPSSHLGFLIQQRRDEEDIDSPYPPLFVPPLESMLGGRPRLLTDFLSCEPDGLLDGAQPLAARHGLVVVRLFRGVRGNAVHMAVCDLPAGTCNVLPELRLRCEASSISCTILAAQDYPSSSLEAKRPSSLGLGYYSAVFKLLTLVVSGHKGDHSEECNLYTFSSAELTWGSPTKCFDKMSGISRGGFSMLQQKHDNPVVCRGVVHWLAWYLSEAGASPKYYSLDVSAETYLVSLTEISGPVHRYGYNGKMLPILGVSADGSLAMFRQRKELDIIEMWTRESGVWLYTKGIKFNVGIRPCARMWPEEKGGTFLIVDNSWCVRRVDIANLRTEVEKFPGGIGLEAMPVNVDWPVLFLSLLG